MHKNNKILLLAMKKSIKIFSLAIFMQTSVAIALEGETGGNGGVFREAKTELGLILDIY